MSFLNAKDIEAIRDHLLAIRERTDQVLGLLNRDGQDTPPQRRSSQNDIIELSLDVSKIPFKIKGGSPARDTDGFAFTFLANREGQVWASNTELANALDQYDKVKIGKFVYQLSKDRKFIQRVVHKEAS